MCPEAQSPCSACTHSSTEHVGNIVGGVGKTWNCVLYNCIDDSAPEEVAAVCVVEMVSCSRLYVVVLMVSCQLCFLFKAAILCHRLHCEGQVMLLVQVCLCTSCGCWQRGMKQVTWPDQATPVELVPCSEVFGVKSALTSCVRWYLLVLVQQEPMLCCWYVLQHQDGVGSWLSLLRSLLLATVLAVPIL